MRTVTISASEEFSDATEGHRKAVESAIGYLSMWAISSDRKKNVTIHGDNEGNLNAVYKNESGDVTYNIFAQHDGNGNYSFHS